MTLIEKQKTFLQLLPRLIDFIYKSGYEGTIGQAHRPIEVAKYYSENGNGVANSLHCLKLAIDLNLFKNGKYLVRTEDYRTIGEYWETLSGPGFKCCWGGHFQDGNHFSIEHNGVR